MGHVRIGTLTHTKNWNEVVDLIATGSSAGKVAEAVVKASQTALHSVRDDTGFREAVYLLVQMGVAATKDDPLGHMADLGVNVPGNATVLDVTISLREALERNVNRNGERSEFGAKASDALTGALTRHLQNKVPQLFSTEPEDIKNAFSGLRKKTEFGELGRDFFSRLTYGSMDWFVSRTLSTHLGDSLAFPTTNQMRQFEDAMKLHCEETSFIVKEFCGDWCSKARYEGGGDVSKDDADKFGWGAITKMRKEFTLGKAETAGTHGE